MAANITYSKTIRGQRAFTKGLPDAVGQVLSTMSNDLTEEAIFAKLNGVNKEDFKEAMTWLLEGGFIKMTDSEPLSNTSANTFNDSAIQVNEISIDEFATSTKTKLDTAEQIKIKENKVKLETLSHAVETAKKETAKQKAAKQKEKALAEKEKARLEAIEEAKQAAIAKAKETAHLKAEAEAKKIATINAKKEEWAKVKEETKAKEKEKAEAEERAKAEKWAQLKIEAKEKAEEKARLKALAKAEEQIKRQRAISNTRAKSSTIQWFKKLSQWVKSLFVFAIIVLCLLIVTLHFINIPMLTKPIEKFASTQLQDNVHIQSAHLWLLPKPHLLLKELTIEGSATTNVKAIRVFPNWANVKEKIVNHQNVPYTIQSLQVEGLSIAQKDLALTHIWQQALTQQSLYRLNIILLKDTNINLNTLKLPMFDSQFTINSAGLLEQVDLHTKSKSFTLSAKRTHDDYLIDLVANNWRLPATSLPSFTQLNATGIIKNDVLTLSSINGQFSEGKLTGSLQTNLASASLATKGRFTLTDFAINRHADPALNKILSGTLNSSGSFAFNIDKIQNIINQTKLNTTFNVKNGLLKRIDIAEAMRNNNLNGSTNFTRFSGQLSLNNNHYQFTNLALQDKQLQASGQLSISPNHQIAGTIASTIAVKNNPIHTNLIIEGPVTAPRLKD